LVEMLDERHGAVGVDAAASPPRIEWYAHVSDSCRASCSVCGLTQHATRPCVLRGRDGSRCQACGFCADCDRSADCCCGDCVCGVPPPVPAGALPSFPVAAAGDGASSWTEGCAVVLGCCGGSACGVVVRPESDPFDGAGWPVVGSSPV